MSRFTPRSRENIRDFYARTSRYFRNPEDIEEVTSMNMRKTKKGNEEKDEAEEMLKALHHYMESTSDQTRIKYPRKSDFVMLVLMVASICILMILFHELYFTGRWIQLETCQSPGGGDTSSLPDICFNCFGPFSNKWLWCVE